MTIIASQSDRRSLFEASFDRSVPLIRPESAAVQATKPRASQSFPNLPVRVSSASRSPAQSGLYAASRQVDMPWTRSTRDVSLRMRSADSFGRVDCWKLASPGLAHVRQPHKLARNRPKSRVFLSLPKPEAESVQTAYYAVDHETVHAPATHHDIVAAHQRAQALPRNGQAFMQLGGSCVTILPAEGNALEESDEGVILAASGAEKGCLLANLWEESYQSQPQSLRCIFEPSLDGRWVSFDGFGVSDGILPATLTVNRQRPSKSAMLFIIHESTVGGGKRVVVRNLGTEPIHGDEFGPVLISATRIGWIESAQFPDDTLSDRLTLDWAAVDEDFRKSVRARLRARFQCEPCVEQTVELQIVPLCSFLYIGMRLRCESRSPLLSGSAQIRVTVESVSREAVQVRMDNAPGVSFWVQCEAVPGSGLRIGEVMPADDVITAQYTGRENLLFLLRQEAADTLVIRRFEPR